MRTQSDILEIQAIREARDWKREMERVKEAPHIRTREEQVTSTAERALMAIDGTDGLPGSLERARESLRWDGERFGSEIVRAAVLVLAEEMEKRQRWIAIEQARVDALTALVAP